MVKACAFLLPESQVQFSQQKRNSINPLKANKMKKLLFLLMLACSTCTYAQDVIVKKDGSTIPSKVLEIGQDDIIYKRYDQPNGPTYSIKKSEIQSINYQNGAKDTFSPSSREANRFLPNNQNDGEQHINDKALLDLAKRLKDPSKQAKSLKTIGWIGGGTLFCVGGAFLFSSTAHDAKPWQGITGLSCLGSSVIWTTAFLLSAKHYNKLAKSIQSSTIYQQEFKFKNGSTVIPSVDLLNDQAMHQQTIGIGFQYNF